MTENKEYRFKDNPKEQEFYEKFKARFKHNDFNFTLSAIIYGWRDEMQDYPKQFLTSNEEKICLNLIQWLGSPVGQGFLDECGFVPKK